MPTDADGGGRYNKSRYALGEHGGRLPRQLNVAAGGPGGESISFFILGNRMEME